MMTGLKPCRDCETPVSRTAEICPHCGADAPALGATANSIITLGVLAFVAFLVAWIFL